METRFNDLKGLDLRKAVAKELSIGRYYMEAAGSLYYTNEDLGVRKEHTRKVSWIEVPAFEKELGALQQARIIDSVSKAYGSLSLDLLSKNPTFMCGMGIGDPSVLNIEIESDSVAEAMAEAYCQTYLKLRSEGWEK